MSKEADVYAYGMVRPQHFIFDCYQLMHDSRPPWCILSSLSQWLLLTSRIKEALTGKVPFEGASDSRVIYLVTVRRGIPPRPDTDVCDGLWAILNSCWDRESSKRPSIMSVSDRLRALVAGPRSCQREPGRSSSPTLDIPQVPPQDHSLKAGNSA